jgi:hypothetical protein
MKKNNNRKHKKISLTAYLITTLLIVPIVVELFCIVHGLQPLSIWSPLKILSPNQHRTISESNSSALIKTISLNGSRYEKVYVFSTIGSSSVSLGESFLSLIVISPLFMKGFFDYLNSLNDFSELIGGALQKIKQNIESKCKMRAR